MRRHEIVGLHLRRRYRTTIRGKTAMSAADLLAGDFTAEQPNVKWCGEIAYLRVGRSWMFLATVIDLYSRRLIGYAMAEHMRADLVIDALRHAVAAPGGQVDGVIFHTDHGSVYVAAFRESLRRIRNPPLDGSYRVEHGQCRGRVLVRGLKRELPHGARWATPQRARLDVFGWISFYNNKRRHSTLGYQCPAAYENRTQPSTAMLALAA
ncbi:hypothetical protein Rhe02_38070 [Rhizocola hellebori]|uniref:Integrase catalytic domain-containing protein n=1 Tax=Rhizocola hellebori TaxID=1392758 RepID=A0A8J3VGR8_9ACTN|nr:DDE-type integrase/transposase/recombinase [Rhizocola hellebori]GIH05740.1 hypothetical protein Rhe02_38070 [Rhizocola hellebori]